MSLPYFGNEKEYALIYNDDLENGKAKILENEDLIHSFFMENNGNLSFIEIYFINVIIPKARERGFKKRKKFLTNEKIRNIAHIKENVIPICLYFQDQKINGSDFQILFERLIHKYKVELFSI